MDETGPIDEIADAIAPASKARQTPTFAPQRGTLKRIPEFMLHVLRWGMFFLCVATVVACGSHSASGGIQAGNSAPRPAAADRVLRRSLPGEPQTLDPQLADDTYSFQVVRDLYEGLTAEDRQGQIVPGVAKSWTVDNTGTIYRFQLRPDARWSDGKRVVADEFVQALRRVVDPKTAAESAVLLSVIKGAGDIIAGHRKPAELQVSAVGDSTVQIELEHPAPYVLQILAQPVGAPVYIPAVPSKNASPENPRMTDGPYVLVAHVPNANIDLARNPHYWNIANVAIANVRYVNAESEATELREYIAGQLDVTFTIPTADIRRISLKYPAEVQTAPVLATFYLALNVSQLPLRDSRDLRQALSMAVDREAIANQVMMGVTPAYAFVAKGISGYAPPEYEWATWSRDRQLQLAKTLFERAGYSTHNVLRLRLYFNRDEGIQRIMVAIAGSWRQNLGVECELISDEFRVFLAGRRDRKRWDVARLAWNADYDDPASFLDVFARNNLENDPGYESAEFNELIERARVQPQQAERIALLMKSERLLLADYPIIPIYYYRARRLVKPYVGGAEITALNHTYTKHLFWKNTP